MPELHGYSFMGPPSGRCGARPFPDGYWTALRRRLGVVVGNKSSVVERRPTVLRPDRPSGRIPAAGMPLGVSQPWLEDLLSTGARKGSLLIVDDDQTMRDILRYVLEREGYRVRTADDGVQCLRSALTLRPDLILLNYLMPVMDGLSALREIKINPVISYLKVVMFSAVGDFITFRAVALEDGALDCLHTPFEVKTLLSAVEKGLRS